MKILAVLQARVSSSRLPGKVLRPVLGRPMLLHQIERIQRSKKIDHLVVATSTDCSDDMLVSTLKEAGIDYMRGPLENVLERFYMTAKIFHPKHIIRLTGDCPLADPQIIDNVINFHIEGGFDYSSNNKPPTFPDGLDVEVFDFDALEKAKKYAKLPSEIEHVTPWIYNNSGQFSIGNFQSPSDNSALRWTVDELKDFIFINEIYSTLYVKNPEFDTQDILDLLKLKPSLIKINQDILRNEGMIKSLEQDKKFPDFLN